MRAFFANVKYDNSVLACFLCPPFSTVRVEQKLAISSVRLAVYHTVCVCVLAIRGVGVCVDTASSLVPSGGVEETTSSRLLYTSSNLEINPPKE